MSDKNGISNRKAKRQIFKAPTNNRTTSHTVEMGSLSVGAGITLVIIVCVSLTHLIDDQPIKRTPNIIQHKITQQKMLNPIFATTILDQKNLWQKILSFCMLSILTMSAGLIWQNGFQMGAL